MKLRFQADADLNEDIVTGVLRRESRIDFKTATTSGLRGLTDMEVLRLAAQEGRVLVSHDRKTMPRAFFQYIQSSESPGLFLVSQRTEMLDAIESLLLAWTASDAEEWENRMIVLPF
ncbi:MAG: DUF5615 family PIN-like protein [Acidobacteria bacterium]|nr:DUF5615 family PIN-like protein [Acidobacteriota bacterium]MBS1866341.1 DUF5615 family PIN-like protein [Acidobacteriota bacterium]